MIEYVWYCPEFDEIKTDFMPEKAMFKDSYGDFSLSYFIKPYIYNKKRYEPFYTFKYYLIGEL